MVNREKWFYLFKTRPPAGLIAPVGGKPEGLCNRQLGLDARLIRRDQLTFIEKVTSISQFQISEEGFDNPLPSTLRHPLTTEDQPLMLQPGKATTLHLRRQVIELGRVDLRKGWNEIPELVMRDKGPRKKMIQ